MKIRVTRVGKHNVVLSCVWISYDHHASCTEVLTLLVDCISDGCLFNSSALTYCISSCYQEHRSKGNTYRWPCPVVPFVLLSHLHDACVVSHALLHEPFVFSGPPPVVRCLKTSFFHHLSFQGPPTLRVTGAESPHSRRKCL